MFNSILQKFFGLNAFRGSQLKIIESIVKGHNTLVVMSTGSGKSLCYQLPAVAQEGMAIVISPLIALMKNQVDVLNKKKIPAACLNSSLPKKVIEHTKQEIKAQKIKLLYISPETLNKEATSDLLKKTKISFIAVDEAHCISDWGHDFRPEYRNTRKTIKDLGKPPIIALTATATPKVQRDILKSLEIEDSTVITSTFYRHNLHYQVLPKQEPEQQIISFIKKKKGEAGIVYCHSRKKSAEIAELFQLNGINAAPYNAGLDTKTRERNQDAFIKNEVDVIVATIAFGMGIDKPNVRFVIHYDPPKSLENYYQETGRAGRDGEAAQCLFFYDPADTLKIQKLSRNKPTSERETVHRLTEQVDSYARSALCRTKQILYYFGEKYKGSCGHCDNCQEGRATYKGKEVVKLLLQAISQTQENYSSDDLIKILIGTQEEHLTLNGTNQLESFQKGRDYTPLQWKSIIKQLLIDGYLSIKHPDTDILLLTPKGKKFLQKPYAIKLLEDLSFEVNHAQKEGTHTRNLLDEKLLKKLIDLRDKMAITENLKPYLIFQENELHFLASYYPMTVEELAQIARVGLSKAKKFGKPFVQLISAYVKKHNITPPTHIVMKATTHKSNKTIQLIQQIDRKTNLKDIARQNGMTYEAFLQALEAICYRGIKLNLDYYINEILDEGSQEDLYAYFEEEKEDNIEKALEDLEDEFSEEEIRLMHIKFLSRVS